MKFKGVDFEWIIDTWKAEMKQAENFSKLYSSSREEVREKLGLVDTSKELPRTPLGEVDYEKFYLAAWAYV